MNSKDADSLKFRGYVFVDESIYGAVACGEFNGKNSFGAYAGWKGFIITELNPVVMIENPNNFQKFAKIWNNVCIGKK